MSRIMSFGTQRVLFTFLVFLIVFAFTTAVLWGHIEGVITEDGYQTLAKAGLLLLPAVALIMTVWELFVDKAGPQRIHPLHATVVRLINWCFIGSIILAFCEVIHSGAILKYASSTAEQAATIAAVGDAQAKVAGAATSAGIEAAGRAAKDLNSAGQGRSAAKILNTGKDAGAEAAKKGQEEIAKIGQTVKPKTYLPSWYINGGMYVALPLLALIFFGITMFFARAAAPYVDADDDGRADSWPELVRVYRVDGLNYWVLGDGRQVSEKILSQRFPGITVEMRRVLEEQRKEKQAQEAAAEPEDDFPKEIEPEGKRPNGQGRR